MEAAVTVAAVVADTAVAADTVVAAAVTWVVAATWAAVAGTWEVVMLGEARSAVEATWGEVPSVAATSVVRTWVVPRAAPSEAVSVAAWPTGRWGEQESVRLRGQPSEVIWETVPAFEVVASMRLTRQCRRELVAHQSDAVAVHSPQLTSLQITEQWAATSVDVPHTQYRQSHQVHSRLVTSVEPDRADTTDSPTDLEVREAQAS